MDELECVDDVLFLNDKPVMLVGFDIYNFLKNICDNFLTVGTNPDMTEGEMKAYKHAVTNVLSLLNQTLNEMIQDEEQCYSNIVVHVPGLETMTEYLTIEEIINDLIKKEEK